MGSWSQNSCQPAAVLVTGQIVRECSSENLKLCQNGAMQSRGPTYLSQTSQLWAHLFHLLGCSLKARVKAAIPFSGNPGDVPSSCPARLDDAGDPMPDRQRHLTNYCPPCSYSVWDDLSRLSPGRLYYQRLAVLHFQRCSTCTWCTV